MRFICNRIILVPILLVLSGCQTTLSVSQSNISVKNGVGIQAYDEETTFFNLYAPDLSVNEALVKKCPRGTVTGVETTLVKRELIVFQKYELRAKASCQNSMEEKVQ